jgi:hypothetical protein
MATKICFSENEEMMKKLYLEPGNQSWYKKKSINFNTIILEIVQCPVNSK